MPLRSMFLWASLAIITWRLTYSLGSENIPDEEFLVGVGISDVTGPATELGMMGYADMNQVANGIHMRLFSRAFIFQKDQNDTPVVYVAVDLGMIADAAKLEVVRELEAQFGSTYTAKNLLLSATHTHSGPSGYMQYTLYNINSEGFVKTNFRAIVDGIVESITKAHNSRQRAKLSVSRGELDNASINRSPYAYEGNPEEEQKLYNSNVDKDMVLLRIDSLETGQPMGLINWFAVHPTSMNKTNKLVSGDNKGYAAQLFEKEMNPPGTRIGTGKFVAAFGSTNLGDVSPNIQGPRCINTGSPCDYRTSTCPLGITDLVDSATCIALGPLKTMGSKNCIAFGPGKSFDMKESTRIIGQRQYEKARELFLDQTNLVTVKGPTDFVHQYINMSRYEVTFENGTKVKTCPAALGYAFAAGTTDGPGPLCFNQADTEGHPFWNLVRTFIKEPSEAQIKCHHPKPILIDAGEMKFPHDWVASIVETQMIRVGNLYIAGFPGEMTTMAGRRMRKALKQVIDKDGPTDSIVVIAGLSNTYTHYVATFEEYQRQRYEGASTLYGPNTLSAYLQQFSSLTTAMLTGGTLAAGPTPPLLIDQQFSLLLPIVADTPGLLRQFGDCIQQPKDVASPGETIVAKFVSGNPRNNPLRGGTFFLVEYKANETDPRWQVVATDADWSTEKEPYKKLTIGLCGLVPVAALLLLGFCFVGRRFFHAGHARDATPSLNTATGGPETSEAKKNNYPAAVKSPPDQQITQASKFVTSKFLERAAPSCGLEKVATFNCGEESVRKGTLNLEFAKDRMIAYLADGTVKLWNWRDGKENSINFGINLKDVTSLQYDEEIVVLGTAAGTVHLFDVKKLEEKWSVRFGDRVDSVKFFESTLIVLTRGFYLNKFWWMDISRADMKLLNRKLVLALPTDLLSRLVRWLFPDRANRLSKSVGILLHSEYCYLYEECVIRVLCAKSGDRITDERGNRCLLLTSYIDSGLCVTSLISTNRFLIAGCKNGTIAMWNNAELRSLRQLPIKTMDGHTGAIRSLCGLNDHLLSVDENGKLFMWSGYDLENKDVAPVPRVLDQNFLNVSCLTGNERWFASSSSENGIINIWALPDLWLRTG